MNVMFIMAILSVIPGFTTMILIATMTLVTIMHEKASLSTSFAILDILVIVAVVIMVIMAAMAITAVMATLAAMDEWFE